MVMNQKINNYYKLYIMQYERIFKLTFAIIAINHYRFKCSRNDSQNFKHLKSDKKKNTGLNYLSWLIVQTAFALLKRCDLLGFHVIITYFILLFY